MSGLFWFLFVYKGGKWLPLCHLLPWREAGWVILETLLTSDWIYSLHLTGSNYTLEFLILSEILQQRPVTWTLQSRAFGFMIHSEAACLQIFIEQQCVPGTFCLFVCFPIDYSWHRTLDVEGVQTHEFDTFIYCNVIATVAIFSTSVTLCNIPPF